MIIIKSDHEIQLMRESGKVTGYILKELENIIKPGISTYDINKFVEDTIYKAHMTPTFKGYGDFPAGACVSPNEVIVHGIPNKKIVLKEGDIVSVDIGATHKGYVSDAARTYPVGKISSEAERLIRITRECFFEGIRFARAGGRLSDISHAVQEHAEAAGYGVVRDYVGHGVGHVLHEDPQIPNYGKAGRGPRLVKAMTLAIEPMIVEGSIEVVVDDDDWTARTADGKLAAHYENSIVITDGEPEILTLQE